MPVWEHTLHLRYPKTVHQTLLGSLFSVHFIVSTSLDSCREITLLLVPVRPWQALQALRQAIIILLT